MQRFMVTLGYFLTRLFLAFHYKVEVRGKDSIKNFKHGVIVGLGHASYLDPPIIASQLARYGIRPRPVVYSAMYDALSWVMSRIGGFRIESLADGVSDWKAYKIRKSVADVKQSIANGDTILLYPSGQTKGGLRESLGGKSSLHELLAEHPDTPLLAVNIYGLYGSIWGRYFADGVRVITPEHRKAIVKKNFWRFFKRVPVILEFQELKPPKSATPRELNQYLENVYNAKEDRLIPGRETFQVEGFDYRYAHRAAESDSHPLDPVITTKVIKFLAKEANIDPATVTPEQSLEHDLGLDSMAQVGLMAWIEEEFSKQIDPDAALITVRDVIVGAQGGLGELETDVKPIHAKGWREIQREAPGFPENALSIPHGFLLQMERMGRFAIAMTDDRSGIMTYGQVLERALMLARVIRSYPEEAVGVMLPASVAGTVVALALMLAGKRLVELNWTNGRAALDYAIEKAGVKRVLSSDVFLDKSSAPLSEMTAAKIVPLEALRSQLGLVDLLRAKYLASLTLEHLLEKIELEVEPDAVAVELFTSGSEAMPKRVQLSHRNILTNVAGSITAIGGKENDVMLGFLPAFHSFGFTQILTLCLVGGVKTVFEPDPKKYKRLALAIEKWDVTLVAGTPDFLSGILTAAEGNPQRLKSLRAVLSGAQKASDGLKAKVKQLGVDFLEGYGITETAPLVSVTRPGEVPIGVGRPIDGVSVIIVDVETATIQKTEGCEGLILISGPNVFNGYVDDGHESPFVEVAGLRYYNSKDIGYISNGSLVITDRLKRIRKFAGEMISIGAIEAALTAKWPSGENGPTVAVEAGKEREGQPPIFALYTTDESITLEAANDVLRKAGLPPHSFVRKRLVVTEIPLLGSGKVNYRALPEPDTLT